MGRAGVTMGRGYCHIPLLVMTSGNIHDEPIVIDDEDVNTYLSFRNIPTVNILPVSAANTYELIDNKALVFTADALKRIEEVLA